MRYQYHNKMHLVWSSKTGNHTRGKGRNCIFFDEYLVRQAAANSVDPDQTGAGEAGLMVLYGSVVLSIPPAHF